METSRLSWPRQGHSHGHSHSTVKLRETFWWRRVSSAVGRELFGRGSIWGALWQWTVPSRRLQKSIFKEVCMPLPYV